MCWRATRYERWMRTNPASAHCARAWMQVDIQPLFVLHGAALGLSDEDVSCTAKEYGQLLASFA